MHAPIPERSPPPGRSFHNKARSVLVSQHPPRRRLPIDNWRLRQARAEFGSWPQIRLIEWAAVRKRFAFDEVVHPIPRMRAPPHLAQFLSLSGGRGAPASCLAIRKCQQNRHRIRSRKKNPLPRVRSYEFEAAPDTFSSTKFSSERCGLCLAGSLSHCCEIHPGLLNPPPKRHCLL